MGEVSAIGFSTSSKLRLFINLEVSPKEKEVFYPFIDSCKNVLECNCVTGKFSMLIKVAFETTMELDAFIDQLQQRFGVTETQIVFSTAVEHREVKPSIFNCEN